MRSVNLNHGDGDRYSTPAGIGVEGGGCHPLKHLIETNVRKKVEQREILDSKVKQDQSCSL